MTDDALERAFRALRETEDGKADSGATRRVVVSGLRRRAPRHRAALKCVAVLAAALAASTALAAGASLWSGAVRELSDTAPPTARVSARARWNDWALPGESASAAPDSPPSPPPSSAEPPRSRRPARSPPSRPEPAPDPSTSTPDRQDSVYGDAHREHFASKDPARALAAWDAYLREFPEGRFAPEAGYNRGIALVRLHRNAQAIDALRPFAEGRYGGYRQKEARELVDALSRP